MKSIFMKKNDFEWMILICTLSFFEGKALTTSERDFCKASFFYIYYKWAATFTDSMFWIECKLSLGIFFNWRREPLPSSLLNIGSWFHPTGCLIVIWIFFKWPWGVETLRILMVYLWLHDHESYPFVFHHPVFKKVSLAGLNSLWQKSC